MKHWMSVDHRHFAILVLALSLGGCSGGTPTGLEGPLTLLLNGVVDTSLVTETGLECRYSLTARVSGGESDSAHIQWDHGELEWRSHPGGEVLRTEDLTAEDLAELWGSERIVTRNEVTVDRTARMADSSAFQIDHRLRYRLSTTGAVRGSVWRLVCE